MKNKTISTKIMNPQSISSNILNTPCLKHKYKKYIYKTAILKFSYLRKITSSGIYIYLKLDAYEKLVC